MTQEIKFIGAISEDFRSKIVAAIEKLQVQFEDGLSIYFDNIQILNSHSGVHILILLEPPAVMPENYAKRNHKKFDLIVCLSPWRAKEMSIPYWSFQPISIQSGFRKHLSSRIEGIVLINDHKFGATRSSLYGYRRKIIKRLENSMIPIHIYGPNWNMSRSVELRKRFAALRRAIANSDAMSIKEAFSEFGRRYSSYLGHASDKIEVMSSYKFALVIENDEFSLTEKIFDALHSGCVVFYRGPQLDQFLNVSLPYIGLSSSVEGSMKIIKNCFDETPPSLNQSISKFAELNYPFNELNEETVADDIARHIAKFKKSGLED